MSKGGAIICENSKDFIINLCNITNNKANFQGGGFHLKNIENIILNNNYFQNN